MSFNTLYTLNRLFFKMLYASSAAISAASRVTNTSRCVSWFLHICLWVVNRRVFDLPYPLWIFSDTFPLLSESIASTFLTRNGGPLACTGECEERISVVTQPSGKQQDATGWSWIKTPALSFLCKMRWRSLVNFHFVKWNENSAVPGLYP